MRSLRIAGVGTAAVALVLATPALASAQSAPHHPAQPVSVVRSTAAALPFNLAIDGRRVLVADSASGQIDALRADGSLSPLVTGVAGASGVATRGKLLAYTSTVSDEATFVNTASGLNIRTPGGKTVYADLTAYEAAHNPDSTNTYGAAAGTCLADVFGGLYPGALDSHAYSVTAYRNGWLVADAGANDILYVDDHGRISTVAVLPPQPAVVTAEAAAALGAPDCVIGEKYIFEPVPTDVAVGADGALYVSTLPGGPEGPELGARGAVWRVDPRTHAVHRVAGGFLGATNLALGAHGEIYVAELFGNRISVVKRGVVSTFAALPGAVAVATAPDGTVWAAGMAGDGPGSIVSITNGKVHVKGHFAHGHGWSGWPGWHAWSHR